MTSWDSTRPAQLNINISLVRAGNGAVRHVPVEDVRLSSAEIDDSLELGSYSRPRVNGKVHPSELASDRCHTGDRCAGPGNGDASRARELAITSPGEDRCLRRQTLSSKKA